MGSLLFYHWIQSWSWTCLEMCKLSLNDKHSHWEADSPFPNSSTIFRSTAVSQVLARLRCWRLSRHCTVLPVTTQLQGRVYLLPPWMDCNRGKMSHLHVLWHSCTWKLPLYFWYGFAETESSNQPYSSTILVNSFRKVIRRVPSKECDSSGTDCWKRGLGAGGTEPQAFTQLVEEGRLLSGEEAIEGRWITISSQ